MYIDRLKNKLLENGIYLKGATNEEVCSLEKSMNVLLPDAYKEFLYIMGHGADQFLIGSDCLLSDDFNEMREQAQHLLLTNGHNKSILDKAFVFWMHQGYQFSYFYLNEGENPKIHYFSESDKNPSGIFQIEPTLEEFLLVMLEFDL